VALLPLNYLGTENIADKEGHIMSLTKIQKEFASEYNALGEEERQEIAREHKENMSSKRSIRHPLPRSRLQDVANVKRNMIGLVRQ